MGMTDGPWIGVGVFVRSGTRIEGARYHIAIERDPKRRGGLLLKGQMTFPLGALRAPGETVVLQNSPMGFSETLELETGESIFIVPTGAARDGGIEFLVSGGMPGMQVF